MDDAGRDPSGVEQKVRSSTTGPWPRVSEIDVERAALPAPIARAGAGAGAGSITLVTGSPGAGKTTLMASWARAIDVRGDAVGWATLGSDDNDSAILTTTLRSAARHAIDNVSYSSTGLPQPPARPLPQTQARPGRAEGPRRQGGPGGHHLPASGLVATVAPEIIALGDLWLLIDDVHLVRDPEALETLETLLHQAPPNLHVVLGSRADPSVHLSRLRLQGRLREVRDHDLRLSRTETATVIAQHGIRLDDGQVTRLHRLTEGWAAGVGLAALSLTSGRDPESFLSALARDDGAVAAYLVDEVLASIDDDRREFMLDTCVPDELDEQLAVRLSGRDDAGLVLAHLTAANSLITLEPDSHPTTYRYHPLLRNYLRARLRAESLQRSNLRHAQTAVWFTERGRAVEAVDHAVASGDETLLRAALHRFSVGLLLDGDTVTIERAVALLPRVVLGDPALLAVAAIASLQSGDLAAARVHLATARAAGDLESRLGPGGSGSSGDLASRAASPPLSYVPLPPRTPAEHRQLDCGPVRGRHRPRPRTTTQRPDAQPKRGNAQPRRPRGVGTAAAGVRARQLRTTR